jgi:putative endonuclease
MPLGLTQATLHALDWLNARIGRVDHRPQHLQTGQRGEEAAYFYLRKIGYIMVARNYRSPRRRGEIDLIGWEGDGLCFIEVKTRTTRDVKPAHLAVDRDKKRELIAMAHEYLRLLRKQPCWRMDILSVYFEEPAPEPRMELFKNAFPVA